MSVSTDPQLAQVDFDAVPRQLYDFDLPAGARILDFGCGYGRTTAPLLVQGYDAWGVDISAHEIERGREYLTARGLDPNRLTCFDEHGRAPFDDGYFDAVSSAVVFEHVEDLDLAVGEIARLTRSGGVGVHTWPARWSPMESHLRMRFVHWLPKNQLRRAAIHAYTRAGIHQAWPPELPESAGPRRLAEFSYRYSVNETFYRSFREVTETFRRHGFETWPDRPPRVRAQPRPLQPIIAWGLRTFRAPTLLARKR